MKTFPCGFVLLSLSNGPGAHKFSVQVCCSGTAGTFAEAFPARIQAQRVSNEPASDEIAAARRSPRLRLLLPNARSRKASGTGPDNNPAARMARPLVPDRNGSLAGIDRNSMDAPTAVSTAAAPIAIRFSTGDVLPASSRADAADAIPEAAK